MQTIKLAYVISLILMVFLTACGSTPTIASNAASPSLVTTAVASATKTSLPTKTSVPTGTVTSTAEPEATATPAEGSSGNITEFEAPDSTATPDVEATVTASATPKPTATATQEASILSTAKEFTIEFMKNQFPRRYSAQAGKYGFTCIIDNINVNPEDQFEFTPGYRTIGFAECHYFDVTKKEVFITIPLAVENIQENRSLLIGRTPRDPGSVVPLDLVLRHLEGGAKGFQGPGQEVSVSFAMPNDTNRTTNSRGFMAEALKQLYTADQLAEFARTGDPAVVNGFLVAIDHIY